MCKVKTSVIDPLRSRAGGLLRDGIDMEKRPRCQALSPILMRLIELMKACKACKTDEIRRGLHLLRADKER